MDKAIAAVLDKLRWMREEQIWPNGGRYLWTDAFGAHTRVLTSKTGSVVCFLWLITPMMLVTFQPPRII